MPTLIRLVVVLLVLVGIGFGAMLALVMMVNPEEKEVTIRIPPRELLSAPTRAPLVRREIDTTRTIEPPPAASGPAEPADGEGASGELEMTLPEGEE